MAIRCKKRRDLRKAHQLLHHQRVLEFDRNFTITYSSKLQLKKENVLTSEVSFLDFLT